MRVIGDITRRGARIWADREALVGDGRRLSYGELDARTDQLANALLDAGATSGDRIAILSDNSTRYVELFFAAAKAGLVMVPLNTRLAEPEILAILNSTEPKAVFLEGQYDWLSSSLSTLNNKIPIKVDLNEKFDGFLAYEDFISSGASTPPSVDVHEDDLTTILFTGGTTGLPKGVMLSHRNELTAFTSMVLHFEFTKNDITCQALPLFHSAFFPTFTLLMVGGKVVVLPKADGVGIARSIEAEKCTHLNAVPTLYIWMLDDPEIAPFDLTSLRIVSYGGSPFPEAPLRRCIEKFGPIFVQGYGLTEAAPTLTFMPAEEHVLDGEKSRFLKSAGREMFLTEVNIADDDGNHLPVDTVGEVIARGANIMMGYWKNEELTKATLRNGWLHTGDLGYLTSDGYLFLVDRKAHMIITGGENVYPKEVEDILYKHSDVRECVVVSVPDDKWGERVHAVVVLQDDGNVSDTDLIQFCKGRLAGYKCPKTLDFWAELPKTPVGKLLRKDVKASFWKDHSGHIS